MDNITPHFPLSYVRHGWSLALDVIAYWCIILNDLSFRIMPLSDSLRIYARLRCALCILKDWCYMMHYHPQKLKRITMKLWNWRCMHTCTRAEDHSFTSFTRLMPVKMWAVWCWLSLHTPSTPTLATISSSTLRRTWCGRLRALHNLTLAHRARSTDESS